MATEGELCLSHVILTPASLNSSYFVMHSESNIMYMFYVNPCHGGWFPVAAMIREIVEKNN